MIGRIIGEGKKTRYFLDGKQATETKFRKAFPDKPIHSGDKSMGQTDWRTPVESYGAACHPKRIKEFEEHCRKHGVPTDFTTLRGRPIFRSRAHQLAALKALHMNNNDEVRG